MVAVRVATDMLRWRGGRVVAWRGDEVWNDRNEEGDNGGRQMLRAIHYTSLALRKENDRCLQGCSAAEG